MTPTSYQTWTDSTGRTHHVAYTSQFDLLVSELQDFQERRRRAAAKVRSVPTNTRDQKAEQQAEQISRADHLPSIRQGRPGAVRKSFAAMLADLGEMVTATRAQTAEIQRQTALALFDDLNAAARAGRLDALSAARVDALRHANATALGLTQTGIRS